MPKRKAATFTSNDIERRTTILAGAAFAVALISGLMAAPITARAEIQYPWCAEYGGHDNNATNCGFTTIEQCRANISGIGGYCYENPSYPAPTPRRKKH